MSYEKVITIEDIKKHNEYMDKLERETIRNPNIKRKKEFKTKSMSEYITIKESNKKDFLIDKLLPQGELGLLVGAGKSNKTTLAYYMAQCLGTGNDYLGHKINGISRVLYICSEGDLSGLGKTFGYNDNIIIFEDVSIQLEDYIESIRIEIIKNDIKVIFLDCLYRMTRCDMANAKESISIITELQKIIKDLGVTIVMLHHTSRANGSIETDSNNISGSMNISRASEFTLMIDKPQKDEDEELLTKNMTLEEYENRPVKRIVRKIDYRNGGTGWDKLDITIDFNKGIIEGCRYLASGIRVKPEERIDDLYNYALDIIKDMPIINKSLLSVELSKVYPKLTVDTIKKCHIPRVIEQLENDKLIEKSKGYNYRLITKQMTID